MYERCHQLRFVCCISHEATFHCIPRLAVHHAVDKFFLFFSLKMSTFARRRLPSNRRRLLCNRTVADSSTAVGCPPRRWLPFKCSPIECLNNELAAGRSEFSFVLHKNRPGVHCPSCHVKSSRAPPAWCVTAHGPFDVLRTLKSFQSMHSTAGRTPRSWDDPIGTHIEQCPPFPKAGFGTPPPPPSPRALHWWPRSASRSSRTTLCSSSILPFRPVPCHVLEHPSDPVPCLSLCQLTPKIVVAVRVQLLDYRRSPAAARPDSVPRSSHFQPVTSALTQPLMAGFQRRPAHCAPFGALPDPRDADFDGAAPCNCARQAGGWPCITATRTLITGPLRAALSMPVASATLTVSRPCTNDGTPDGASPTQGRFVAVALSRLWPVTPPPLFAAVRGTGGVSAATFGTIELGGSFSVRSRCLCDSARGDGPLGLPLASCCRSRPVTAQPHCRPQQSQHKPRRPIPEPLLPREIALVLLLLHVPPAPTPCLMMSLCPPPPPLTQPKHVRAHRGSE